MKKLFAVVAVMSSFSAVLLAETPFGGTWKTNLAETKFSSKPIVFSVRNGLYNCDTCEPRVHIKADGNDQSVAGLPRETLAVKEIDSHTITIVYKKDGKVISEQIRTASEDGQTLHTEATIWEHGNTKPIVQETTSKRMGKPESSANVTSGSWETQKMSESESVLFFTFSGSETELSLSVPTGFSWTAKFDDTDYPVKGSSAIDSVVLKRNDSRSIEANYKHGGQVIQVDKMTVSADGRSMTTVREHKMSGRISTWVATKQ